METACSLILLIKSITSMKSNLAYIRVLIVSLCCSIFLVYMLKYNLKDNDFSWMILLLGIIYGIVEAILFLYRRIKQHKMKKFSGGLKTILLFLLCIITPACFYALTSVIYFIYSLFTTPGSWKF